jgi:murein DD-endopeptidase MepM/ murein hydrolase activator NlpD
MIVPIQWEELMRFPLPFVPITSYKGGNGFGASRDKVRPGLKHAANDLAAPPGTPVLAMDGGVVLRGPYPFFRGTHALEIQHPQFIARYCEIAPDTEVSTCVNVNVMEGQVIAYVGNQPGNDMLHIEFFRGGRCGDLTQPSHPPYDRRDDVFDGAKYLDATAHTISHWPGARNYRYFTDEKGRKFLERMDLRDI